MKQLVWVGADGREWWLHGPRCAGVFVEQEGVSSLDARLDLSAPVLVGSVQRPLGVRDGVVAPVEVSLQLVFASRTVWGKHGEVAKIRQRFLAGCSPTEPGALMLVDDQGLRLRLSCVVAELGAVHRPNAGVGAVRQEMKLRGVGGVWETVVVEDQSSVTVTNTGDVMVYPKIRWVGSGGQVTLPSGARVTLPATPRGEYRVLNLDPASSLEVTDTSGDLDEDMWHRLWSTPPEGIPVGESKTYRIPNGCELVWSIGFLSPWKAVIA